MPINQPAQSVQEIRVLIVRHRRWDVIFSIVGLFAMLGGVITLAALVAGLAIDGLPRVSWDFFRSEERRVGKECVP